MQTLAPRPVGNDRCALTPPIPGQICHPLTFRSWEIRQLNNASGTSRLSSKLGSGAATAAGKMGAEMVKKPVTSLLPMRQQIVAEEERGRWGRRRDR